ncbi:Lateral Root Primordium type 1, C-terminal [Cynara cardunculus var. scolymus]|uniref:Lateral Root Primordium type 1, C-terminal n=1 Tax=Cynara cardunculus var. scolymus TaxID=59895 RepID=A0A103XB52_CYNCS|nr:Lateral Root Primordium type 1, C-terminal [Cynara cardunculus var. scolymus]
MLKKVVVASSRSSRLQPSDSGAFADWVANPSSSRPSEHDLSLGFNAGPASAVGGSTGIWSSSVSAAARHINYGAEIGMLGLRDVFVVAPSSHHLSDHAHAHSLNTPISNATAAAATATALGVGVIPLLTATTCLTAEDDVFGNRGGRASNTTNTTTANNNNSIQFWQPQNQHNYLKKPMIPDHGFLHGGGSASLTSGSTMTCQDCGNQAKKDCSHRRCRTCCKSRGFDCATHVKSTWVPAARRRERQLMTSTTTGGGGAAAGSSASTSATKKPRLTSQTTATTASHTSTSNTTPPRSFNSSSSHHHQDASFMQSLPGQVRAPAVFKCVRVTAVEDGDDEYAYQACVKIGGHVFKGFLYDQGAETRDQTNIPNLSELHLGGGGRRNVGGSLISPPLNHPSTSVYGSSGGGLLG